MVTGGTDGFNGKSVELLATDGTKLCSLPNLPAKKGRHWHSQTGLVTCGGGYSETHKSCVTFSAGRWKKTHTLRQRRYAHTAWASPRGVLLMGGTHTSRLTDLLTDDGDTIPSFNLTINDIR